MSIASITKEAYAKKVIDLAERMAVAYEKGDKAKGAKIERMLNKLVNDWNDHCRTLANIRVGYEEEYNRALKMLGRKA